MRRSLTYADAIALLGGDSGVVAALDRALGGALLVATAGASGYVANLLDARGEAVRAGHQIVGRLRDKLRGYSRYDRTQRLRAAHTVIVVTAFFEALGDLDLPFDLGDVRLIHKDRLWMLEDGVMRNGVLETLVRSDAPLPGPSLPPEDVRLALRRWYHGRAVVLGGELEHLAVWDTLNETGKDRTIAVLDKQLPDRAVERYEILYRRLAVDAPEFAWWSNQLEHEETRALLRRSLASLEELLRSLPAGAHPDDRRAALSRAYRATLDRPILGAGDDMGMNLPTLDAGYVDPDFRVGPPLEGESPANESYWQYAPVRTDLAGFLAGQLTAPAAVEAPLLVLGQPGAGKSVLTRILAARLPADAFLAVRVELREVPADADLQDQLEHAVRRATGEAVGWPDLARSAGDALPVVLLDGFDELLQATGVSQTDYLDKVARFQQREADQGRPVAVVVTSRTAVADRARIPAGTVLLRLEPFRREQIERWVTVWNEVNAARLHDLNTLPLSVDTVLRYPDLAGQPLLLLMLALYDANANDLQRHDADLDAAGLYERLLSRFARRELRKTHDGVPADVLVGRVDEELLRLSVVAFAMFNRGRQWIEERELDRDLAALLGDRAVEPAGLRAPLGRGEAMLGRFFFVQRAQATRDGARLATYEFLHATFGEYLVARLVHRVVLDLAAQERAAATAILGTGGAQDGLLYALLSYAPLTARGPVLRFLRALAARVPDGEAPAVRAVPVSAFRRIDARTDQRYADYAPVQLPPPARYGRYGLNLVLLATVYAREVSASTLLPGLGDTGLGDPGLGDPVASWRRHALLWQSSLTTEEWSSVLVALRVRRLWVDGGRDLCVSLADTHDWAPVGPVDLYWTYDHPGWQGQTTGYIVSEPGYWQLLSRQAALTCDAYGDFAAHLLEPLLTTIGPLSTMYTAFTPWERSTGDGPVEVPATMLNALLRLWVGGELGSRDDRVRAFEQVVRPFADSRLSSEFDIRAEVVTLVLHRLVAQARRLPTADFVRLLDPFSTLSEDQCGLFVEAILAHLATHEVTEEEWTALQRLAEGVVEVRSPVWLRWRVGLREVGRRAGDPFHIPMLAELPWERIARDDPRLLARARWMLKAEHGIDVDTFLRGD